MNHFFEPHDDFESLGKNELFHQLQKSLLKEKSLTQDIGHLKDKNARLEALIRELKQGNLDLTEQEILNQKKELQNELFGKSSERSTKEEIAASVNEDLIIPGADDPSDAAKDGNPAKRVRKPSERYPKAEVRETHITPENPPQCPCCDNPMKDSGLTEESEKLTVIPRKLIVERLIRHKFNCAHCQGALVTAKLPPSLVPGGSFSDNLMIDVSIAKYSDLMPIQRYIRAAERCGVEGLPSASVIECTHVLAQRFRGVYRLLKQELLREKVLHADETPHRMLEGDKRENWYFWGFSSKTAAYFETLDCGR